MNPVDLTFKLNGAPYWDFAHWQGNPANKSRQVQFVDRAHSVFGSKHVFRAECDGPSDSWPQSSGNSAPRCMVGAWSSTSSWYSGPTIPWPTENSRWISAFAFEIEAMPGGLLPVGTLYEKHQSNDMAALAPVAMLGLYAYTDGWLYARLGGGQALGGGWQTYWNGSYMRVAPLSVGVHMLVFDVMYTKGTNGYMDVHHALNQDQTWTKPVSQHTGQPTWPWAPNLPPEKPYGEAGIYPNGMMSQRNPGENQVYHYGALEWFNAVDADLQAAFASFKFDAGTVVPPAKPEATTLPVVSGTLIVDKTLVASQGVWSNSPTSYAYQWQYTRDGTTWLDVAGAEGTSFLCADTFLGCPVRVVVTAANAGGSTSAVSAATPAIAAAPPVGFTVTGVDNGDGTVTLSWTKVDAAEEYVPTIDDSEYLTDHKRHPIGPGQLSTRIAKPHDDKQHKYGVRVNDRIDDAGVTL